MPLNLKINIIYIYIYIYYLTLNRARAFNSCSFEDIVYCQNFGTDGMEKMSSRDSHTETNAEAGNHSAFGMCSSIRDCF
jgi:hypothetical protein